MATDAQIKANRRNSLKSTGPSSSQEKEIAKMNALRHGLCAETAVLKFEDAEEFQQLRQSLEAEFQPATAREHLLFEDVVRNAWRLQRACITDFALSERSFVEAEKRGPSYDIHPDDTVGLVAWAFEFGGRRLRSVDLTLRQESKFRRAFYKAVAELERLQAARTAQTSDIHRKLTAEVKEQKDT